VTAVVIFRASDRQEVGAVAHLPADPLGGALGRSPLLTPRREQTVIRTVCGQVGIGRTFVREGPTCAFCLAMTGQHPGGHGKRYLTRWHRAQHPRQSEEIRHGR
jgi:hypothetical protein